jgi:hypothetical protein
MLIKSVKNKTEQFQARKKQSQIIVYWIFWMLMCSPKVYKNNQRNISNKEIFQELKKKRK